MGLKTLTTQEIDALEIVLSHSNLEDVFDDWLDRGEPSYHYWICLKDLLGALKRLKPTTPLDYPKIVEKLVLVSPYDNQIIYKKD